MVEENEQLAARIDGELQVAHKEVDTLRKDLADTNRRIAEMQATSITSQKGDYLDGDLCRNLPLINGTEESKSSFVFFFSPKIYKL